MACLVWIMTTRFLACRCFWVCKQQLCDVLEHMWQFRK